MTRKGAFLVEGDEALGLLAQEGEGHVEELGVGEVADQPTADPVLGEALGFLKRQARSQILKSHGAGEISQKVKGSRATA